MKRVICSVLATMALCFSATTQALPIYSGDTAANFGVNPGASSSNAVGYYIWSNATYDNWSVRWTGNDFGDVLRGTWGGGVFLTDLANGSVVEVKFEANQRDATYVGYGLGALEDSISFDGRAGSGYDGFNFALTTQNFAVLNFSLWSTNFTGLAPSSTPVEATGIYLGQGFEAPMVDVVQHGDKVVQNFQVNVPEPTTLVLLGLGLVGVGFARTSRRK